MVPPFMLFRMRIYYKQISMASKRLGWLAYLIELAKKRLKRELDRPDSKQTTIWENNMFAG